MNIRSVVACSETASGCASKSADCKSRDPFSVEVPGLTVLICVNMDEANEIIIINDLLCFLQCKIENLLKESIIQLLTSFYKHEVIAEQ